MLFAYLLATAFWLRAWKIDILSISGIPDILAISSISSTTTGSTMNAGTTAMSAISLAIIPPRFEACSPLSPLARSAIIASFTSYVPPSIGLRSPPLPTMASKLCGLIPTSTRDSIITSFLNDF